MTEEFEVCKQHALVDGEIENLKQSQKDLWECVNTKTSTSFAKWTIGIFIVVSMAVVGFLWSGQRQILGEIKEYKIEANVDRKTLNVEIDFMKDKITDIQHSLDLHIADTKSNGFKFPKK